MGLSSLPSPSGVLCVLLVNTALPISTIVGIIRSILHIVGIHLASSSPSADSFKNPSESLEFCPITSDIYMEEFQSRTPSIRFDAVCSCKRSDHKCPVCLTRFKPESEVNHLTVCLEEWLNYQKVTCPSCRTPQSPAAGTGSFLLLVRLLQP